MMNLKTSRLWLCLLAVTWAVAATGGWLAWAAPESQREWILEAPREAERRPAPSATPFVGIQRPTYFAGIRRPTPSAGIQRPTPSPLAAPPAPPRPAPTPIIPAEATPAQGLPDIDETILANKLRLDRAFFSPCIVDDNAADPRYRRAVRAFQESRGLDVDGSVGPVTSASLGRLSSLTREFVLEDKHFDELVWLPEKSLPSEQQWLGLSRMERLGYESIPEMLAERYHTSREFLSRLNPGRDWRLLMPGDRIRVPRITRPWPEFAAARLVINIQEKTLRVYDRDGLLRAFFNCSIGTDKRVYDGLSLEVAKVAEWPEYTFKPALFGLEGRIDRALFIPPGPNNPVGQAWMGLSRAGYGIHGTPDPERIGQTESHGCIRLPNWDAMALYRTIRLGTAVEFVGGEAAQ
jgi:lipoprotein-anchoring transpeptidase ErfK/SrfK